jgi:hypothetical protein
VALIKIIRSLCKINNSESIKYIIIKLDFIPNHFFQPSFPHCHFLFLLLFHLPLNFLFFLLFLFYRLEKIIELLGCYFECFDWDFDFLDFLDSPDFLESRDLDLEREDFLFESEDELLFFLWFFFFLSL